MLPPPPAGDSRLRLLHNARREAWIVLATWAAFISWVVGFSYLRGYQHAADSPVVKLGLGASRSAADFHSILGMPDWIFYGVALPWIVAVIFTIYFGFAVFRDDDLGEEASSEC